MRGGYRMVVPRASRQGWAAAFTGRYDDDRLNVVRANVVPGSTVLDVGASLGFWTLLLAMRTDAGQVVAYEPLPGNLAVLEANVDRNRLRARVRVEPVGLGARDEEVVVATEAGGAGNGAIVADRGGSHDDLPDRVPIRLRT